MLLKVIIIFFENVFLFLNGQLMSSIVGASVGIVGVWLTIRHDRQRRRVERKDKIKPIISIVFDGFYNTEEKNYKLTQSKRGYLNPYAFAFVPLLTDGQKSGLIWGYLPPQIGRISDLNMKAILRFNIRVDGDFPVTDLKVIKIRVVGKDDPEEIDSDRPISIGEMPPVMNEMFDFYHQHNPKNFEKLERLGMTHVVLDTNMLNAYVSPGENVFFEVPLDVGMTLLSGLIETVRNRAFS